MADYYRKNRIILLARSNRQNAKYAIADINRKQPNYSEQQIEERLLEAGTKKSRFTIILKIQIQLAIAEGEYEQITGENG